MASKVAVATSHNESHDQRPQLHDIFMKIDGLVDMGNGEFKLADVPVLNLDHSVFADTLMSSGIPKREAYLYAEEILEVVGQRELARLLAARMTRTG